MLRLSLICAVTFAKLMVEALDLSPEIAACAIAVSRE